VKERAMEKKGGYMHEGMSKKSPSAEDKGVKNPSRSVNDGATRDSVAEGSSKTLGPRTA